MRAAHQGVPVIGLPTAAPEGGFLAGLFGGRSQQTPPSSQGAPIPPGSIPQAASATAQRQTDGSASLDGFLLNNLFGRRN